MSPEAYWQELKNEYALEGVNLGLMPDVRGMREDVAGFLTENFGEGIRQSELGSRLKLNLIRWREVRRRRFGNGRVRGGVCRLRLKASGSRLDREI